MGSAKSGVVKTTAGPSTTARSQSVIDPNTMTSSFTSRRYIRPSLGNGTRDMVSRLGRCLSGLPHTGPRRSLHAASHSIRPQNVAAFGAAIRQLGICMAFRQIDRCSVGLSDVYSTFASSTTLTTWVTLLPVSVASLSSAPFGVIASSHPKHNRLQSSRSFLGSSFRSVSRVCADPNEEDSQTAAADRRHPGLRSPGTRGSSKACWQARIRQQHGFRSHRLCSHAVDARTSQLRSRRCRGSEHWPSQCSTSHVAHPRSPDAQVGAVPQGAPSGDCVHRRCLRTRA